MNFRALPSGEYEGPRFGAVRGVPVTFGPRDRIVGSVDALDFTAVYPRYASDGTSFVWDLRSNASTGEL
jgi:hypothetical protein